MNLVPVKEEAIQGTAQILLTFLDSPGANVPGNLIEGVVSGKSMLRGLLSGSLVLCQPEQPKVDKAPPRKKET